MNKYVHSPLGMNQLTSKHPVIMNPGIPLTDLQRGFFCFLGKASVLTNAHVKGWFTARCLPKKWQTIISSHSDGWGFFSVCLKSRRTAYTCLATQELVRLNNFWKASKHPKELTHLDSCGVSSHKDPRFKPMHPYPPHPETRIFRKKLHRFCSRNLRTSLKLVARNRSASADLATSAQRMDLGPIMSHISHTPQFLVRTRFWKETSQSSSRISQGCHQTKVAKV